MKYKILSLFLACAILLSAAPAAYAQNTQSAADSGETALESPSVPSAVSDGYTAGGDIEPRTVDSGEATPGRPASSGQSTAPAMVPPSIGGDHTEEGPFVLCAEDGSEDKLLIVLGPEDTLDNALPLQVAYLCEDGRRRGVYMSWDTSGGELGQPGLHRVEGVPVTDDVTVSLADGYDGKVVWPVFRKGGGQQIEAAPIQMPLLSDPLIPLGEDAFQLDIITTGRKWAVGTSGVVKSDESWIWEWDCSEVDTSKEGEYTVTGRLAQTPDYITVAEENRTVSFTVYVLPTDRIEIYAAVGIRRRLIAGEKKNILEIK